MATLKTYILEKKGKLLVEGEAVGSKIGQGIVNVIQDTKDTLDSLIAEISSDELEKNKKIKLDLDEVKDGITDSIPFTDELVVEVSGYTNGLLTYQFNDTIKDNSDTELPIEISLVKRMLSILE